MIQNENFSMATFESIEQRIRENYFRVIEKF